MSRVGTTNACAGGFFLLVMIGIIWGIVYTADKVATDESMSGRTHVEDIDLFPTGRTISVDDAGNPVQYEATQSYASLLDLPKMPPAVLDELEHVSFAFSKDKTKTIHARYNVAGYEQELIAGEEGSITPDLTLFTPIGATIIIKGDGSTGTLTKVSSTGEVTKHDILVPAGTQGGCETTYSTAEELQESCSALAVPKPAMDNGRALSADERRKLPIWFAFIPAIVAAAKIGAKASVIAGVSIGAAKGVKLAFVISKIASFAAKKFAVLNTYIKTSKAMKMLKKGYKIYKKAKKYYKKFCKKLKILEKAVDQDGVLSEEACYDQNNSEPVPCDGGECEPED